MKKIFIFNLIIIALTLMIGLSCKGIYDWGMAIIMDFIVISIVWIIYFKFR